MPRSCRPVCDGNGQVGVHLAGGGRAEQVLTSALSDAPTRPGAAGRPMSSSQAVWEATPVKSTGTFVLAQPGLHFSS